MSHKNMLPEEGSPFCSYCGFDVLVLSAEGHPSCSYAFLIFLISSISEQVVKGLCSCTGMGKPCPRSFGWMSLRSATAVHTCASQMFIQLCFAHSIRYKACNCQKVSGTLSGCSSQDRLSAFNSLWVFIRPSRD